MQQNSSYVVPSYPQLNNNSSKQIPNKELIPNKTNLNNEEIKHLLFFSHYCNHSKKFGFITKLTGAGGGGCAVTLLGIENVSTSGKDESNMKTKEVRTY